MTATSIMELETILHAIENSDGKKGANVRDPELLLHHLRRALSQEHLGLAGRGPSRVVAFHDRQRHGGRQHAGILRYQSGEVRVDGPKKGLRILGSMEDAARALMASFDDAQRATAVYDKVAPTDILTKNSPTFDVPAYWGVTAATSSRRKKIC